MPELSTALTALHLIYLIGVILILAAMAIRRETPMLCILLLFLIGLTASQSLAGGIQVIFRAVLYAAGEFMEIIATIALVTALSRCLSDLGSNRLMIRPFLRVMRSASVTWWILGLAMLIFSLFLWPSPSVALIGAILLPLAVNRGLTPLAAAMAMNLFGHGVALSWDFIIQGAPAISAASAGITPADIITDGAPLFLIMGISTVFSAFLLNRNKLLVRDPAWLSTGSDLSRPVIHNQKQLLPHTMATDASRTEPSGLHVRRVSLCIAVLTPLAFAADLLMMLSGGISGSDAVALLAGAATLLLVFGSLLAFGRRSPEKVSEYLTHGFLFAIRVFAPVILIGAFFFLGGDGITRILGTQYSHGFLIDWALWLANRTPVNPYVSAFLQLLVGAVTGLDGSGFSGLPLTGTLAQTFGLLTGASVPVLAALGQISAVYVGGGTLAPWGLISAAAICGVDPVELAKKNLPPVLIGFACTFAAACLILHA
ncbi:MAG: citrate transporter [Clostridiales bacterium]|nr:citrate transporter [Clostridiales bacterium]